MEALDYSMIQVKSTIEIERLLDLEIKREFNQHGMMKLRGIVHEDTNYQGAMRSTTDDTIEIKTNERSEDKKTLFKGVVSRVDVACIEGTYYIEVQAYSGSIIMDLKKKKRSFQNSDMEYSALVKQIAYEYTHGDAETPNGMKEKIHAPIIQYDETDWELLKRLATHMNTVLLPDVQDSTPRVFVGIPEGRNRWNIGDDIPYKVKRDYHGYNMVKEIEGGAQSTDFLYYEIESYDDYEIGDEISFRNKKLIISSKTIRTKRGMFIFTYTLAFKEKLVQNKAYNPNIAGVGLIGTIIEVKEEHVRIHLDIDDEQKKEEAHWFNVNTLTGNALYCMPEVGTRWNLIVPTGDESYAEVVSSIRTNGGGCPKTSDPSSQYLSSDSGKEMAMSPASISFTSMESEEGTLKLNLDDEEGIRIISHKSLNISAKEDIEIRSKGSIIVRGSETIVLQRGTNGKGISLENEINLLNSKNIYFRGLNKLPFPPVEASPQPETKPKKKGFSWGNLLKVAVAAVAVVAAVTITAATLGAGGVLLAGIAMGATAGVAAVASKDIANNEFSGLGKYIEEAIEGAIVGAVVGAIFAPISAAVGGVGAGAGMLGQQTTGQLVAQLMKHLYIGGTASTTYFTLDKLLDGEVPEVSEMLNSFKNGVLFTGFFMSAGAVLNQFTNFMCNHVKTLMIKNTNLNQTVVASNVNGKSGVVVAGRGVTASTAAEYGVRPEVQMRGFNILNRGIYWGTAPKPQGGIVPYNNPGGGLVPYQNSQSIIPQAQIATNQSVLALQSPNMAKYHEVLRNGIIDDYAWKLLGRYARHNKIDLNAMSSEEQSIKLQEIKNDIMTSKKRLDYVEESTNELIKLSRKQVSEYAAKGYSEEKFYEIASQEKSMRDPDAYLKSLDGTTLIEEWNNDFYGGDSKVVVSYMPKWAYENFVLGGGAIGRAGPTGGQFVLPQGVADNIESKIFSAGSSSQSPEEILAVELGLPKDAFKDGYVRVNIPLDGDINLHMVTGIEDGCNYQWIPGGKTLGGTREGMIKQITRENNPDLFEQIINDIFDKN